MAETAPSGPMSLAKQRLRVLLANSSTWQTWTGTANATAALETIYINALAPPPNKNKYTLAQLEALRPFAIVETSESGGFKKDAIAGGIGFVFDESGQIVLSIEANTAEGDVDDPSEAMIKFENNLGNVISEMATLAGTTGTINVDSNPNYLNVNEISVEMGPMRSVEDVKNTEGDFHFAVAIIGWGV